MPACTFSGGKGVSVRLSDDEGFAIRHHPIGRTKLNIVKLCPIEASLDGCSRSVGSLLVEYLSVQCAVVPARFDLDWALGFEH